MGETEKEREREPARKRDREKVKIKRVLKRMGGERENACVKEKERE